MTTPITGLGNNSPLKTNTPISVKTMVQAMVYLANSKVYVYSNDHLPADEKKWVAVIVTAYELSLDAQNQGDTKTVWDLLSTLYEQNKDILGGPNSSWEDFQARVAGSEPLALREYLLHKEAKRLGMEYTGYALRETPDGKVAYFSAVFEVPGPSGHEKDYEA